MTGPLWEEVEVPRGQFIGWGFRPGQVVTGKVLAYSPTGGTDVKGKPCPQLSLELIEACDNYRERGTVKEHIAAGELVVVTAGLVSLKRALTAAQPEVGNLVRLEFTQLVTVKTPEGPGEVKDFKVSIDRSKHAVSSSASSAPAAAQSSTPPF